MRGKRVGIRENWEGTNTEKRGRRGGNWWVALPT